jgi:hypothetical protein
MPSDKGALKDKIREYKRANSGFVPVLRIAKALAVDPIECFRAALEVAEEDGREVRITPSQPRQMEANA